MTEIVKIGKSKMVVGLEWLSLDAQGDPRKQINTFAEEQNSKIGCVLTLNNGRCVGFVKDNGAGKGYLGLFPAAAGVAKMLSSETGRFVIIYQLADDRYWFVDIFSQEAVRPGTDLILDKMAAQEKIKSYARNNIEIFGNDESLHENVKPINLEEIFKQARTKLKKESVRYLSGKSRYGRLKTLFLLLLFILCAFGFFIYQYKINEKNRKVQAEENKLVQLQTIQTIEGQAYQINQALAKICETPSLPNRVNNYMAAMGQIKVDVKGWKLIEISCQTGECVGRREAIDKKATNQDLAAIEQDAQFTYDGQYALSKIKVPEEIKRGPMTVAELPAEQDFLEKTGSIFQEIKKDDVEAQIEPSYNLAMPNLLEKQIKVVRFRSGGWKMRGNSLYKIEEIFKRFEQERNMTIIKLVLIFDQRQNRTSWTAEGQYAIQ